MSRFALIDRDGFILRPSNAAKFTLPVIAGISETEPIGERGGLRVRRVLGMLKDVGSLAGQISEVDVSDPNNLIVAEHVGSGVVNLMLGDENYASACRIFWQTIRRSARSGRTRGHWICAWTAPSRQ